MPTMGASSHRQPRHVHAIHEHAPGERASDGTRRQPGDDRTACSCPIWTRPQFDDLSIGQVQIDVPDAGPRGARVPIGDRFEASRERRDGRASATTNGTRLTMSHRATRWRVVSAGAQSRVRRA
ncbi:MAG: hypothetical protein R3C32_12945 [Chloroflexota bacterium]